MGVCFIAILHVVWQARRRGNGTRFTAILRKSQFNLGPITMHILCANCSHNRKRPLKELPGSCPGKRKQHVTPLMAAETKWFRSPYVGVVSFLFCSGKTHSGCSQVHLCLLPAANPPPLNVYNLFLPGIRDCPFNLPCPVGGVGRLTGMMRGRHRGCPRSPPVSVDRPEKVFRT